MEYIVKGGDEELNKAGKIILGIALVIIVFGLSAFGMYKYNELEVFNNLSNQGKQYMLQKDYDKAIQSFQQALSYKKDTDTQSSLVLAQNLKSENSKKGIVSKNIQLANEAAKNNKYDEANKYLDEILKTDPNNSEVKSLKDSYAKAVQEQQEKAKAQEQVKLSVQQQNNDNNRRKTNVEISQQQASQIVANRFKDCDVFLAERNDYTDRISKEVGNGLYLFYTEFKDDHSGTQGYVGVDKITGETYDILPGSYIRKN